MGEILREVGRAVGREMPCAGCGYDLRGTGVVGGERRCSECGAAWRGRRVSRVPWGRRREVGRVRAYLMTVWMVVRRPWEVGREALGPVCLRDVAGFERVSLWVGTVLGVGLVGSCLLFSEPNAPYVAEGSFWITPAFVLADSVWGLVALGASFFVTAWWVMGWQRWLLVRGVEAGVARARAGRAARYLTGVAPVMAGLFGGAFVLGVVAGVNEPWTNAVREWAPVAAWTFVGLGVVVWVLVPLVVMGKVLGFRFFRMAGVVMAVPVAVVVFYLLLAVFAWVMGYGAMAVYSMTH